jgi:hypothetical protein
MTKTQLSKSTNSISAPLASSPSRSNLKSQQSGGGSGDNLNRKSLGVGGISRSKSKLSKLAPTTDVYIHSKLVRVQTSCCILDPSSSSSTSKLKKDDNTVSLSQGINWLVDAIIHQWQNSDMPQRIEKLKAQQEAKYEEERRKQKERVEKYRQDKAATQGADDGKKATNGGGQMGDRSWSSSNMQAGIWGGIPSNGLPPRSESKRYSTTAAPPSAADAHEDEEDADAVSSKVTNTSGSASDGKSNKKAEGRLPNFPRAAFQGPEDDDLINNNGDDQGVNKQSLDNNILLTKNVPVPARAAKALPPISLGAVGASGGSGRGGGLNGGGSNLGTPLSSPSKSSPLNHSDLPPIVPRRKD